MAKSPIPVIIDSDMASDDWMAILYLLQSPAARIEAITLAATGEAHTWPGIQTGLRLLKLADQVGIPVTAGRSKPLRGNNSFPLLWRIAMDCRLGLRLPRTKQKRETVNAVQLIAQLLSANECPVTIVALGPLTNIGELLQHRPDLARNIAKIVVMGGAIHVSGNIEVSGANIANPHAEWNIFVDPAAANIVFRSEVPIILVPLDVTNLAPITALLFERLKANRMTPPAEFVFRTLQRLRPMMDKNELYFWDPLTAVVATHEEIFEFVEHPIYVIEEDGPDCGRTVIAEEGPTLTICTGVDRILFEDTYLNTLNGITR